MKSLSLSQPHAIVMIGIPGSGKTFFARQFSETFNAPFVTIDDITPHSRDLASAGQLAHQQLAELLKTKLSVVVELDSATRASRRELAKQLKDAGYTPLLVWVQTDQDTAQARLVRAKDKDSSVFDGQVRRFSPPHQTEQPTVISGKHTFATQAKVVLKRLSTPRAEVTERKTMTPPGSRNISIR